MRDPFFNYRRILAGHNKDSDSEETDSLLSSSCSSNNSRNFGSLYDISQFPSETEEENEEIKKTYPIECGTKHDAAPSLPSSIREKIESELMISSKLEVPVIRVFDPKKGILDSEKDDYGKLTEFLQIDSIYNNFRKAQSSSLEKTCYNQDYKDPKENTHNSIVTIFAIWNTTMGSSLLAMSWGIQMAGFFPGIIINILIAALCLYTCYLLLSINEKHGMPGLDTTEVSYLCKNLLGKWAEILAKIFSIIVLLGANIVYMILMSNFLYNSVYFLYGLIILPRDPTESNITVLCPKELFNLTINSNLNTTSAYGTTFDQIWNLYNTVPIYLSVILFCVLNFKSPTFFTKFNSLGTISALYLIIFVAVKAYGWGITMDNYWTEEILPKSTFTALSGMLSLSYFIHNIIITIMKNNKNQEHNGRDLTIAFGLITFTYLFIGIVFYISFPLAKTCIEDNILNNFNNTDKMTIIARILLMFQLFTVFPLISFMFRKEILGNINHMFKNYRFGDFSYKKVMLINVLLLFICVMFACFLPKIGTLIRYTGALSGLIYVFMLPNLLQIASLRKERNLTMPRLLWHLSILILGILNLLSQFFIQE